MKVEIEIPDGVKCSDLCPFHIEETPEYQQYCTLVGKAFKGEKKLAGCPAKAKKEVAHSSPA